MGGLYMGVVPTIAKQATNQAVRFPVQFYAKEFLTGGDKSLDANPLYNGAAGAFAGAVSVICTMPQDTTKSRMQGEEAKKLYKGTLDCARQILQNDGIMFFYSGTWPRMIRVSLDVAITFAIFPVLGKYIYIYHSHIDDEVAAGHCISFFGILSSRLKKFFVD